MELEWKANTTKALKFLSKAPCSSQPSSINTQKPKSTKGVRPDPRETNMMVYQSDMDRNSQFVKKLNAIPRQRFFTKHAGEDLDPLLLNTNYKSPAPFAHLKRPQPPPFPLQLFGEKPPLKIEEEEVESIPSRLSLPKPPSLTRQFGNTQRYDADRLDAERRGAFLARRSANTKINVLRIQQDIRSRKGQVVPLAEQVRYWETHLRVPTSQERLNKRVADMDRAEKFAERRAIMKHVLPRVKSPPKVIYAGDDPLVRNLIKQTKKFQGRKSLEMASYYPVKSPDFELPKNSTINKVHDAQLEMITPFNVRDILARDAKKRAEKAKADKIAARTRNYLNNFKKY